MHTSKVIVNILETEDPAIFIALVALVLHLAYNYNYNLLSVLWHFTLIEVEKKIDKEDLEVNESF